MYNSVRKLPQQSVQTIWHARTAVTLGLLSGLVGAHMIFGDLATQRHYQQLSATGEQAQRLAGVPEPATPGIDWVELRRQNEDVAAWVRVEGTLIDYPVVSAAARGSEFYLAHDFWQGESPMGCPFLDTRSTADGIHAMVYGHHMGAGNTMFSELYDCFRQDSFERIGTLTWATPQRGALSLEPLCALTVDSAFEPVQRFSFESTGDLREWLREICSQAGATSADRDTLIREATRAVTLVTCSSIVPGRQQRTIVVFVGSEAGASQDMAVLAGLPPLSLPVEA